MPSKSFQLPPARVITLIVGVGVMLALIFGAILGNWVTGFMVGAVFSIALSGFLVYTSRTAGKTGKRRSR